MQQKDLITGKSKKHIRLFDTNIHIPQQDTLSPVLFTTYLKAVLREVIKMSMPKTTYADDVDFISKDGVNLNRVGKTLEKWNQKMNFVK